MSDSLFRFKKFSVSHSRSSMKVGVDGVLLGAWANISGTKVVDIGTGCGVIALMLAQRFYNLEIEAIDIDPGSIEEATENFTNSPWSSRLTAKNISFEEFLQEEKNYHSIISNPPFFDSGVKTLNSPREWARHQNFLSPDNLLKFGSLKLEDYGRISMIIPYEYLNNIFKTAQQHNMIPERISTIKSFERNKCKRVLLEFYKKNNHKDFHLFKKNDNFKFNSNFEEIILFSEDGKPTPRHLELCGDFYLKF